MEKKKEIKLEFFKQFGNESFKGYPLEQCHAIWEFFEKYIQCQEDIADKIKEAYIESAKSWSDLVLNDNDVKESAEKYYKETFKK